MVQVQMVGSRLYTGDEQTAQELGSEALPKSEKCPAVVGVRIPDHLFLKHGSVEKY